MMVCGFWVVDHHDPLAGERSGDGGRLQHEQHLVVLQRQEERGIFASLDVKENLLLPPIIRGGGMSLDQIFELFPNLKERLGSQGAKLSGGEQQMLAIARKEPFDYYKTVGGVKGDDAFQPSSKSRCPLVKK